MLDLEVQALSSMRTLLLAMFIFEVPKIHRGDCFAQGGPDMRLVHRSLAAEYGFRPPDRSPHDCWKVRRTSVTILVLGSGLIGLTKLNHFLRLGVMESAYISNYLGK